MLRKFLLVAFMALVEPGTTVQLMAAQLICFSYVVALVNTSPCVVPAPDCTHRFHHHA